MWYDGFIVLLNWITGSWVGFWIAIGIVVVLSGIAVYWSMKTDGFTYVTAIYVLLFVAALLLLIMLNNGVFEVPSVTEMAKTVVGK